MSNVTDRRDGVSEGLAAKRPCRVVATSNITLSGTQTIDGVAVVVGERVLVTAQTSAVNNGIYVVSAASWTRAKDFDGQYDAVSGTQVRVNSGTTYAATLWVVSTSDDFTIGSSSLSITQFTGQNGINGATGATGAGYGGTSATSLLIANSVTKTFTTQAGLAYQVGNYVRATSQTGAGSNYMEGTVSSYTGTSLAIAITAFGGSGTFANWVFAISGTPGGGSVSHIATNTGDFTLEGGVTNDVNKLVMQQMQPGGRLTLTSATPVTTTDVTGGTAVYYTPAVHPFVPIYNGTQMRLYPFTASATDTVGLALTLGASWTTNTLYDWFTTLNGAAVTFGTGPAWTSDTARGTGAGTTELQMYNGVWTNKNTMTLRNGNASTISVPANQATYIGTFRTVAAGQAEDSMAKRFLYNAYNQVQRILKNATETTDTWTYTTAAFRQANANTANQLDLVTGLAGNLLDAKVLATASTSAASSFAGVGIGINSTTVNSAQAMHPTVSTVRSDIQAVYQGYPAIGRSYYPWIEISSPALGTTTFDGDAGNATFYQSGISGTILM